MAKKFYFCNVTLENSLGFATSNFHTFAIAANTGEAIKIARAAAKQILPPGWTIANVFAGALQKKVLEQAAIEVLGWKRP